MGKHHLSEATKYWLYLEPFESPLFQNIPTSNLFIIAAHHQEKQSFRFTKAVQICNHFFTKLINCMLYIFFFLKIKIIHRFIYTREKDLLPYQTLWCKEPKSIYELKERPASRESSTAYSNCLQNTLKKNKLHNEHNVTGTRESAYDH